MERIPGSASRQLTADILLLLARFWLQQGINGLEVQELLRWAMVRTALDDPAFSVPGRMAHAATLSRAAVLTGLPRREVQRLAAFLAPPPLSSSLQRLDRVGQVVARWQSDRRFRNRALDVRGRAINGFAELVRSCCRDVPPRAIRDELVLRKQVRWKDAHCLELVPDPGKEPPSAVPPEVLQSQLRALLELLETGLQRLGKGTVTGDLSISERKRRDALLAEIEQRLDEFAGEIRGLFARGSMPPGVEDSAGPGSAVAPPASVSGIVYDLAWRRYRSGITQE